MNNGQCAINGFFSTYLKLVSDFHIKLLGVPPLCIWREGRKEGGREGGSEEGKEGGRDDTTCPPSLPPYFPSSLPLSLPPSLPTILHSSILHSLPPSLPPFPSSSRPLSLPPSGREGEREDSCRRETKKLDGWLEG